MMKLLFDQNISFRILKQLPEELKSSSHVKSEKLINSADRQIWEFAKQNNFTIVTQDADFNDLTSFYGFPPKIIWIRMGNIKTSHIWQILLEYYFEIAEFIDNKDYGCFEIGRFKKH